MPIVSFPGTPAEVATFLHAAQARLFFARFQCTVDGVVWVLGFAQGTPYRLDSGARGEAEAGSIRSRP